MTLVVGRIIQNTIRIDSDSKITDPKIVSNKNSIFSSYLKTILINPRLCISYAGGVDYAQNAIEDLYKLKDFSISRIKELLLQKNKDSNYETDFLIGSVENQSLLYKISNGNIETSNQGHWIGDKDGFNAFQKNFIPNLKSADPHHIAKIQSEAFEEVVTSGAIESVGGFHITVHNTRNGLEYLMKMSVNSGYSHSIKVEANQTVPFSFGDASTGAHSYSYLISKNPFNPAIGIHFPVGNFGTLYYPKLTRKILKIENVNPFEFVKIIKEDYNIQLTGMVKDGAMMRMI